MTTPTKHAPYGTVLPLAFGDNSHHIKTHSGKRFKLCNAQPEDIRIKDITYALSHLCRFTGHTREFYSVAQHSLLCANLLHSWGYDAPTCLCGLLHDAPEAYIGDVSTPLKNLLPEYRSIESRIARLVIMRFRLPPQSSTGTWADVKTADQAAFDIEWSEFMEGGPKADPKSPLFDVHPIPAQEARRLFMIEFDHLTARIAQGKEGEQV